MSVIWYIILGLAAVIGLPFLREALKPGAKLDEAPGSFADLPSGRTHYEWKGPVRGPVAVCVHGLTHASPVWNDIAEGLGETAYRVLVYDLYGRGYSQAVKGEQDADFFCRQLEELLAHLDLSEDITLVGYSMGGAIATACAANHPESIARLILIASSGVDTRDETEGYRGLRVKPFIGDWLHRAIEPFRREGYVPDNAELAKSLRKSMKRKGFFPGLLASRRGMLYESQEEAHRLLGREDIPVIAIWGEQDEVVPISSLGTLAQWNRFARQDTIPGGGHGIAYTYPEKVVQLIREMTRH